MKSEKFATALLLFTLSVTAVSQNISLHDMERIYQEVRTPYKYGLVVAPTDNYHKIDCPLTFRWSCSTFSCYFRCHTKYNPRQLSTAHGKHPSQM